MTYIEGFVLAVPTANKQKFIDHANTADAVFMEIGALRILECWQDNVEKGHTTDFFGAVDCKDDEAVAFSWIEWKDKAAREKGMAEANTLFETDERLKAENNPMPFDGTRMIYGGFEALLDDGEPVADGYIQGFIVPVPEGNKEEYRQAAIAMWEITRDYGGRRIVEAWQDDVPEGKRTDFFRSVKAEPGERIVFSFIEWPSREIADASQDKIMQDERMKQFMCTQPDAKPPFDGRRMVYGGFRPVVELTRANAEA